MKRIIAVLATVALLFTCCITASAAAPTYTALKNTPTLDGVVKSGEYGAAVPFDKSNVSLFYYLSWDKDPTGANSNPPKATYQFAWDKDALYVGITATNVEKINDGKWQIDLSPNKKIKDGKAGIFYTITITQLGVDGIVGIARDNFQTAGNEGKTSMNINRFGASGVATEVSTGATATDNVYNIEVKIPLKEIQVKGSGGDFTKVSFKDYAEWGVGCYFIGNGGGFTSNQGAGNDGDGLVQIYNDLTLLDKDGKAGDKNANTDSATSSVSSDKNTSSADKNDTSDKSNSSDKTESVEDGSSDASENNDSAVSSDGETVSNENDSSDNSSDTEKTDGTNASSDSNGTDPALIVAIVGAAFVIGIALVSSVIIIVKSGSGAPTK